MGYDRTHVAAGSPLTTGGVLWAPKGTPVPTTATGTLDAAFVRLGLVGESGLTPSGEAATKTELRVWGGEVAASVTESRSITRFDLTLVSIFDPDVAQFVYGTDNVTVTAPTTTAGTKLAIQETGDEIADGVLIFDMKFNAKRLRIVVPDADPSVTGEEPFADASLSGYTITTTCLPDTSGVRTYRYYEDDDIAPA